MTVSEDGRARREAQRTKEKRTRGQVVQDEGDRRKRRK